MTMNPPPRSLRLSAPLAFICTWMFLAAVAPVGSVVAADTPPTPLAPPTQQTKTHRISGLFQPDRADDLRAAFKEHPQVKLVSIDFARGEATLSYDPKSYSTDDLGQWLHDRTFRLNPAASIPTDKLVEIEIAVIALDCKGCCFHMHNVLMSVDGVQQATPHLKERTVAVWIDPSKTNQAALIEKLKSRDVQVK